MKRADDANIYLVKMLYEMCKKDLDNGFQDVNLLWITDTLDSIIKAMEKGE